MAEPGDKSLMPLIRPPAINLSLKFLTRQRDQGIVLPLLEIIFELAQIKAAKRSTGNFYRKME